VGVASRSVVVSNDAFAPSVAFTAPTDGATVSGTLNMAGTAADDVSVLRVDVSVDGGTYQQASGTTTWAYSLATTALADGAHTIIARVTDGAGRTATASRAVTVSNGLPAGVREQMVTPEGTTIQIASDVNGWTAQRIYDLLKPNAYQLNLIGPSLTVKVQTQYANWTATSAGTSGALFTSFRATIYLDARPTGVFVDRPDTIVAHEYGHAWTLYHLYITHQKDWTPWLIERGLIGDARVDSTYNWSKSEMIADDYRLLFGTTAAVSQAGYLNPEAPDPRAVPGMRDWFIGVWAGS
jgi:hypothetical protein